MKRRGELKKSVLSCIHAAECPKIFTVDMIQKQLDQYSYVQISGVLCRLHENGFLNRSGKRGLYSYSICETPEPELDPIENLLNAMAKAETALRKLSQAHKLLDSLR